MKILNLEPDRYSSKAISLFQEQNEYFEFSDTGIYPVEKAEVDTILTRLNFKLNEEFLKDFSSLKYIISPTTGLDHIDFSYTQKKGIKVYSLRSHKEFLSTITTTPELAWGLLLALIRNIPKAVSSVSNYRWERDNFRGLQLGGKNLGIIGLGRTGKKVAEYGKAFGMNVFYVDPEVQSKEYIKVSTINELVELSDVVSLHIHLTDETYHLISPVSIRQFKKGSVLINTSRGGVVDEQFILQEVNRGNLYGYATDVLEDELSDISESPVIQEMNKGKNIVVTPHIGGASTEVMNKCEEYLAKLFLGEFDQ